MDTAEKDQMLLALLQGNGRMSVSEIARRLSCSRTAAQMRLQKLERNGVIDGYFARLSPEYLQKQVRALVMVKFPPGQRGQIEEALADIVQVASLYSISGVFDMAAVVSAGSMAELDLILDKMGCLDGVDETMSSIILSTKIDR
ncbi:MAG: Lrp/AsnC family transcriptional regulator [Paracoccaceae bacterium]